MKDGTAHHRNIYYNKSPKLLSDKHLLTNPAEFRGFPISFSFFFRTSFSYPFLHALQNAYCISCLASEDAFFLMFFLLNICAGA